MPFNHSATDCSEVLEQSSCVAPSDSLQQAFPNDITCAWGSVLLLLAEGSIDPTRPGGDELYAFFRQAVDWCVRLPEGHTFKVEARAWACSNVPTSLLMQARQPAVFRSQIHASLHNQCRQCINGFGVSALTD